jgi:diazepam-binding inhibitor (GABA receptor modulating acyl-CoA-binding protein)
MSSLKEQFEAAVKSVQSGESTAKPSNELKLQMYALFKQATDGDVTGKKPGITDFVGRMKYSAWEELKGMSKDKAMQTYIDKINDIMKK